MLHDWPRLRASLPPCVAAARRWDVAAGAALRVVVAGSVETVRWSAEIAGILNRRPTFASKPVAAEELRPRVAA